MDDEIASQLRQDAIVTLVDAAHIQTHLDEAEPEGVENEAVEQLELQRQPGRLHPHMAHPRPAFGRGYPDRWRPHHARLSREDQSPGLRRHPLLAGLRRSPRITVWDFAGPGPEGTRPRTLRGHETVTALAWRPGGGGVLATAGAEGVLAL